MSKIITLPISKEERIFIVKEAYKATLRTFIELRKGKFTTSELTQIIKEAHNELEVQNSQIIKGSNDEYV